MRHWAGSAALACVAVAVLAGCGSGPAAGSPDAPDGAGTSAAPSAGTPGASAGTRLSSADLQSRWWTWATSEPEGTNPVADRNGSACRRNQPRDVWFLAGTFGTEERRTCAVPRGIPVAFPLVNMIGGPEECALFMATAKGTALLDGEPVPSDAHRGDRITVVSVEGNPVTMTGGRATTTGCGLWVQLAPLGPGFHTLEISGRSGDFATRVDYALAVETANG